MSYHQQYYTSSYAPLDEYYYNNTFLTSNHDYISPQDHTRSQHQRHMSNSTYSHPRSSSDSDNPSNYGVNMHTVVRSPDTYYYAEPHVCPLTTDYKSSGSRESQGSRHSGADISPKQSLGPKSRVCCEHPDCQDEKGKPTKYFSRKADVARHHRSQHNVTYFDCPKNKCNRKASQGFTRHDHLIEHLRGYHQEDIPKRSGNSGSSGDQPDSRSRHSSY